MTNRYKSSQKWRKVRAGEYSTLIDGERWNAKREGYSRWRLTRSGNPRAIHFGVYLSLADCQKTAEVRSEVARRRAQEMADRWGEAWPAGWGR